jgi:hypothetical protein
MACYEPPASPQGQQMCELSLRPRPSVRGEEPHPTRGDPVGAEHSGSKGVNLEKQSPILRCECRAHGMNGSGLVCLKRRPPGHQATSWLYCSLARHGALPGGLSISPVLVGPKWILQCLK